MALVASRPDYFLLALDLSDATVVQGIQWVAQDLARIRATADTRHAPVTVISVPASVYSSELGQQGQRDMGFLVASEMLVTHAPDEAIHQAATLAGLRFDSVLSDFRREANNEPLHFRYDGHFNAAGHRLFTRLITPVVVSAIEEARQLAARESNITDLSSAEGQRDLPEN